MTIDIPSSPEAILVLRALSIFEVQYTTRSVNRLNEAIAQAVSGGARSPPGVTEGVNVGRTIANELDTARFDPLLVKAVAKGVASSLDMLISRVDALVNGGTLQYQESSIDISVGHRLYAIEQPCHWPVLRPPPSKLSMDNLQLSYTMHTHEQRNSQMNIPQTFLPSSDQEQRSVRIIYVFQKTLISYMFAPLQNLKQAFDKIVDPLLLTIRRDLATIISRVHRVDFGKDIDPMSSMMGGGGGASFYMKELVEKLSFVKMEILSKFQVPEISRMW
jgi:conserved oligomeric Golgi complex subunit 5